MTYKTRKYISDAWIRHEKRKSRKFYKQLLIAIFLVVIGTILGVFIGDYFQDTSFTQFCINLRIMIFGG